MDVSGDFLGSKFGGHIGISVEISLSGSKNSYAQPLSSAGPWSWCSLMARWPFAEAPARRAPSWASPSATGWCHRLRADAMRPVRGSAGSLKRSRSAAATGRWPYTGGNLKAALYVAECGDLKVGINYHFERSATRLPDHFSHTIAPPHMIPRSHYPLPYSLCHIIPHPPLLSGCTGARGARRLT